MQSIRVAKAQKFCKLYLFINQEKLTGVVPFSVECRLNRSLGSGHLYEPSHTHDIKPSVDLQISNAKIEAEITKLKGEQSKSLYKHAYHINV